MFTNSQIEMLREKLKEAYENAKFELSTRTWNDLVAAIQEHFSENISDTERRTWPQELQNVKEIDFGKRADNFARFPNGIVKNLEPLKLIAIREWLLDDDNEWSTLTKEEYYSNMETPKIAENFTKFLYENNVEKPRFSNRHLVGEYHFKNEKHELMLSVSMGTNEFICDAVMHERRIHYDRHTGKKEFDKISYNGWMTISPNESIFCFFKNASEKCNHLFIPIGVSEINYDIDSLNIIDIKTISNIYFLNQVTLKEFDSSEFDLNIQEILNSWIMENLSNFIDFRKS